MRPRTAGRRPEPSLSRLSPELRTRVWVEFVGLPPRLWSEGAAAACLDEFGALTRFDAASFRRATRMVAEARVARVADLPRRFTVMESVPGTGFVPHPVSLVVLSAEPVSEEEGEGKTKKKNRSRMRWADEQAGGSEVGTEERPEWAPGYVSTWRIDLSRA